MKNKAMQMLLAVVLGLAATPTALAGEMSVKSGFRCEHATKNNLLKKLPNEQDNESFKQPKTGPARSALDVRKTRS